jgi:hypothetical protein
MPWFRKRHACPCGADWWDEWDCLCNDRCPNCDAEIEPDEHEASQGVKSANNPHSQRLQIVDRRTRHDDETPFGFLILQCSYRRNFRQLPIERLDRKLTVAIRNRLPVVPR